VTFRCTFKPEIQIFATKQRKVSNQISVKEEDESTESTASSDTKCSLSENFKENKSSICGEEKITSTK